jgi:hypothetical protein
MNKRIRELAKQAEHSVNEVFVWDPTGPDREDVIREKFAELIVRECLYIADREHKLALESEWDNNDTATSIKDSIKKHFGVEE